MANKYSKLCIDKEKITGWIKLWCESELDGTVNIECTENVSRIQYTIHNQGNIIKIDFIKCSGGLLTIAPNVGKNIDISIRIADNIYERVKNVINNSPFSNGFSIIIDRSDYEIVIELIKGISGVTQVNYSEQLEVGKALYHLYQFRGQAGDLVTIKYFLNTKRMQLQGRPLFLFNEVVSMVSENGASLDEVVDAQIRFCNINISNDAIYEEMEHVLGSDLYSFLSNSQKAIFSTAFILSKIEIDMPDYSGIIQQALRAYEGFVKKMYAAKGIECEGDTQLGSLFTRPDKQSKFIMKPEYSCKIDEKTEKDFTSMYVYYYNKRHPYSHATARDFDTRIISRRNIADEIFNEIISSMKTWFNAMVNPK